MDPVYQNLRGHLKKLLFFFRLKVLSYNLLKGIVFLICSVLFFLLFYSFFMSFQTVLSKTVLFFLFVFICISEFFLLIVYPVFNFFISLRSDRNIVVKQVLKYSHTDAGLFVSIYDLGFRTHLILGDKSLIQAAFVQKYNSLKSRNLLDFFPAKLFLRPFVFFLGIVFILFFWNAKFDYWYTDLKNYQEIADPGNSVSFTVQNSELKVEYGKSFQLKLKVSSDLAVLNNVFICYGGGEFLMRSSDSLFVYDFEMVNNDIDFYFITENGIRSRSYRLNVLSAPTITSYTVTCIPPVYTGLKPEVFENTVDFRVLYGSSLKFDLNVTHIDSFYLKEGEIFFKMPVDSPPVIQFSRLIKKTGELSLLGSNQNFKYKNLLNFTVVCFSDLYPDIRMTEIQDSVKSSQHYFYGVITDDYGFSELRFILSAGERRIEIPINIIKNITSQEFYFSFDFAEFAGLDKAEIEYYFEVTDNDIISGPKSTRSEVNNYRILDLDAIFNYNAEVNHTVNNALHEAEKLSREIVSGVKDLQTKLLDNTADNWEKQQLSKEIIEKKNELDKLLDIVKESNLKKSDLNKSFSKQDSLLIRKQKQIQELFDKIMDDEMKDLLQEFSKLSTDFSKDRFRNLDEKMKLTFDQVNEELDRNIELLKRYQIEEKHDLLSKRLDKIREDQNSLKELIQNRQIPADSLMGRSKGIQNALKQFEENYKTLLNDNSDLKEPFPLKKLESDFNNLSELLKKQSESFEKQKVDRKLYGKIEEELKKLSDIIKQQQLQNFVNKSLPENDIELIIQNILIISLSQEELMKQFSDVTPQSLKYNELGCLQDLKRQEYKLVKDSLSALARSNLMLASILSHKFYEIEIKFGMLSAYIQDNRQSDLMREQQFIINYLNDIVLSLTEALQKSRQNSGKSGNENKKQGSDIGQGDKNSDSDVQEGYQKLKKIQGGLKKQLEDLIFQMKKGEKGKPLQQGISNMIRENELFQKSLNDFVSEMGSMSNAEKQLLNEINRLLDENIKDMANYSVSTHLINRNNQIYSKLLMSEKASREQDKFEEQRKAESAADQRFQKPDIFLEFQKSGLMKTNFQKFDLKLNDYYKTMYNNYYIKLGDE